jgi:hypothetical protein
MYELINNVNLKFSSGGVNYRMFHVEHQQNKNDNVPRGTWVVLFKIRK